MEPFNADEEVLTTGEACKLLRISRQTLYKLVDQGRLPGAKIGQSYKFLKSELVRFLKGGKTDNIQERHLMDPNELEPINP